MYPVATCLLVCAAFYVAQADTQLPAKSQGRQLGFPLLVPSDGKQQTNVVKRIGETMTALGDAVEQRPMGNILAPFMPQAMSTTSQAPTESPTPMSRPGPLESLAKNVENFGAMLNESTKLLEAPIKVINGVLSGTISITRTGTHSIENAADSVAKATENTSKVVGSLAAPTRPKHKLREPSESEEGDESEYYEFTNANSEPYSVRRPKYFSRECQFRFACEVGKIMKPLTRDMAAGVENNRFLQDLQNRYTRAMTYGALKGKCERYYCVMVALFGGPQGFASGVSEMINRVINPDTYEVVDTPRK